MINIPQYIGIFTRNTKLFGHSSNVPTIAIFLNSCHGASMEHGHNILHLSIFIICRFTIIEVLFCSSIIGIGI